MPRFRVAAMQTGDSDSQLTDFNSARTEYLDAIRKVPRDAIGYLKPGDDYSIGGISVHVTYVLEHYLNVLDALIAHDFTECRPTDPDGLERTALARAKQSLDSKEVDVELAATDGLHRRVTETLERVGDRRATKAPVWYLGAKETYPTSANDVLQWLTEHYREHVPHMSALVDDWRAGGAALAVVQRFNDAFGRGDVDAVMELMTDDCVFENTLPPPDGERHTGQAAVRKFWQDFFGTTDRPRFDTEEIFATGDRVVCRWRFDWGGGKDGGHVRGVDVFRVRDGKVAEKLSYVKG